MNALSRLAAITKGKANDPPRLLIYGTEGIGKSTLAASAPNPVFVPTEDGLGQIDCAKFPVAVTFEEFMGNLQGLLDEEHDFSSVVVDSADWLERLIHDRTCKDSNVASIELAAGGYGKGYTAAMNYWRDVLGLLDSLQKRGMAVILLAHAQVEKFDDPETQSYDRYSPRLHKKTSGPLVNEWCDAVLFATRKFRVSKDGDGKNARAIAAPIGKGGGERVLRCVGGPSCVAKNRYGMPDEIPLSWASVAEFMV